MKKTKHAACAQRIVLVIEDLVPRIHKTATTIRTCASNKKYQHLIPPPWKMPHSRRLCWYEDEVQAWIDANRPADPPPAKRPRGRPTTVEQLARQRWAQTASTSSQVKGGGQFDGASEPKTTGNEAGGTTTKVTRGGCRGT
jgi:hypothetical protein